MIDIANLRELRAKATPGQWRAGTPEDTRVLATADNGRTITVCRHTAASPQASDDRDLIVAAVNALPALLAIAEAAEAACDDGPFVDDACPMARLRTALSSPPSPRGQRADMEKKP